MNTEKLLERLSELFKRNENYFAYEMDNTDEFGEAPIVSITGDMVVRHFKNLDVYVQQTGFSSSYDGSEWDDNFTIVKPVEKTITIYK